MCCVWETVYKTSKMLFHGLLSVFLNSISYYSGVAVNIGAHPAENAEYMEMEAIYEEIKPVDEDEVENIDEYEDGYLRPSPRKTYINPCSR